MCRNIEETFWSIVGNRDYIDNINEGVFGSFFNLVKFTVLQGICDKVKQDISESLGEVLELCIEDVRKLMLRTLIYEMHVSEKSGELLGGNEQEKYDYFSNRIVCSEAYLREFALEYPLLYESLIQLMENYVRNISDVVINFYNDLSEINFKFFREKPCSKICSIEGGMSDSHKNGHKVFFLKLDNDNKIVYKPRGISIDLSYKRFVSWVCKGVDVEYWWYKSIDRGSYGWSEWVSFKSCTTYEELCNYYRRNGMLLCISYVLGTEDLHCENVIAHGEYPVIIDLEMAIGTKCLKTSYQNASAIEKIYLDSVLHTGLLPMFAWNAEGEGINVSAINGKGGQLSPFRIPVIVEPGTLNMHVEYRQPELKNGKNLALLNERFIEPYEFIDCFLEGFDRVYRFLIANRKDFEKKLEMFGNMVVRYLERNTQQYSMLLLTSYHPYYYLNYKTRQDVIEELLAQNQGLDNLRNVWLYYQEKNELARGDVPYFFMNVSKHDLYSGSGEKYEAFFDTTPMDLIKNRVQYMSLTDLARQKKLIEMALLIGSQKAKNNMINKLYCQSERVPIENKRMAIAQAIGDLLLEEAIWSEDRSEIGWISIMMAGYREAGYLIRPTGMYLYDGIAGIAVFLAKLSIETGNIRYHDVVALLVSKLFEHTDKHQRNNTPEGLLTGAYSGEASIALAYMILYQMGYSEKMLEYVKKQCKVVKRELSKDNTYDVIGGNAGALLVFVNAYQLTGDIEYLEYAKQAGEWLLVSAKHCDVGIGWKGRLTQKPLTGFAHGISGIMLAFLKLGSITHDQRYMETAYQAFCYEESQYMPSHKNWKDLRYEDDVQECNDGMAWCHGWGGIVAARKVAINYAAGQMKEYLNGCEEVIRDRSYDVIGDDKVCLCHGKLGNAVLTDIFGQEGEGEDMYRQIVYELYESKDCLRKELVMQERDNFGLMGGISGIGYSMLANMDELKCLLCLK